MSLRILALIAASFFGFPVRGDDRDIELIRTSYLETLSRIKSVDSAIISRSPRGSRTPGGFPTDKLASERTWLQSGDKYLFTWTVSAEGIQIPTLRFKSISDGETAWRFVYVHTRELPVYVLKRRATKELFHKSYVSSTVPYFLGKSFNVSGLSSRSIERAFAENSPQYLGEMKNDEHLRGISFSGFTKQLFKRTSVVDIEVWFDTKAGYMPRLFEFHDRTKNIDWSLEIDKFKMVETADGNVWFPVSARIPNVNEPKKSTEIEVKRLEINTLIPNEKFLPNVPDGIEIVDESDGERIKYYKNLIREIAPLSAR